jgi:hypothetical protein
MSELERLDIEQACMNALKAEIEELKRRLETMEQLLKNSRPQCARGTHFGGFEFQGTSFYR